MKTLVVIPTYNNDQTLMDVLEKAKSVSSSVLVVNDGCTDQTLQILKTSSVHVVTHDTNLGKGEAIKSGFQYALENNFTGMIVLDADGQHDPCYIKNFEKIIEKDPKSVIIGVREFQENVPKSSKFGRSFSNFWVWVETSIKLHDTQSGYRYYPVHQELFQRLKKSNYDFEIEILVQAIWMELSIRELLIGVYYPPAHERVSHFKAGLDNYRLSKLHSFLVFLRLLNPKLWKRKSVLYTSIQEERKGANFMGILLKILGKKLSFFIMFFPLFYFFITDKKGRKGLQTLYRLLGEQKPNYRMLFKNYWYFASSLIDRLTLNEVHLKKTSQAHSMAFKSGTICVGAHYGDWLIGAKFCSQTRSIPVGVVMDVNATPGFYRLMRDQNLGITVIDMKQDPIPMMIQMKEFLEAGGCLCFLADRFKEDLACEEVDFLGAKVPIPQGPFDIARLLKKPIYFFTSVRQGGGYKANYLLQLEQLWDGETSKSTHELSEDYMKYLQSQVSKEPWHWFNFFDYWEQAK